MLGSNNPRSGLLTALALGCTLLVGLAVPARSADFWVGPGCASSSINDALFGAAFTAGPDTIRIVGNLTNVDQNLVDWDPSGAGAITISGRHITCGSTARNGPRSVISADPSGPVFDVSSTSGNQSVITLEGLTIQNASNAYAVIANGSGVDLTISDTQITSSDGGLQVLNGADVDLDLQTAVNFNDVGAGIGGGIRCEGSGSTVRFAGIASFNEAGTGGGILVGSQCVLTLADGAYVQDNQAMWGGGIAVLNTGSSVVTDPGLTYGIRIDRNQATLQGGGAWVVNGASMVLLETWVRDNVAGDSGGGVHVEAAGAAFTMDRGDSFCIDKRCSWLDGNSLTSEGLGSAVFVGNNATANIAQTFIENHTALNQRGFVLYAENASTTMTLESVQLWNNHTWALFRAVGNAVIRPRWVSAARNDYRNFLDIFVSSAGATTDTTGIVTIETSVLQDHDTFFSQGGGTVTASCSYVATTGGLSGGTGTLQTGTNAGFLDASRGDLRIYVTSPAVDQCNPFLPLHHDIEHKVRGFDEVGIGFPGDVHDWGAYEATGLFFADGFESGNTSRWSSTTP